MVGSVVVVVYYREYGHTSSMSANAGHFGLPGFLQIIIREDTSSSIHRYRALLRIIGRRTLVRFVDHKAFGWLVRVTSEVVQGAG